MHQKWRNFKLFCFQQNCLLKRKQVENSCWQVGMKGKRREWLKLFLLICLFVFIYGKNIFSVLLMDWKTCRCHLGKSFFPKCHHMFKQNTYKLLKCIIKTSGAKNIKGWICLTIAFMIEMTKKIKAGCFANKLVHEFGSKLSFQKRGKFLSVSLHEVFLNG